MSLQLMKRPFIFAYSALINNKVIEETRLSGFDKCVDSPLNKIKIEESDFNFISIFYQMNF